MDAQARATARERGRSCNTSWPSLLSSGWALRRRLAVMLGRPALLDADTHVVDRYLAALTPLGVKTERCSPRMHLSPAQQQKARALLAEAGWDGQQPLVALAPGARWPTKAPVDLG